METLEVYTLSSVVQTVGYEDSQILFRQTPNQKTNYSRHTFIPIQLTVQEIQLWFVSTNPSLVIGIPDSVVCQGIIVERHQLQSKLSLLLSPC